MNFIFTGEEDALNLFVEMWNEVIENGYSSKTQTSFIQAHGWYLKNQNYLCEAYLNIDKDCRNCPFTHLFWEGKLSEFDSPCLDSKQSPYKQFHVLFNYSFAPVIQKWRRDLAIEIAQIGIDHD